MRSAKYDRCGPEETAEWQQFSLRSQWIRKSFSAKEEIVALALATEDDILILDPESEFGNLTVALGGEVVKVSATSGMHLNAMDMDSSYGDDTNPLIENQNFYCLF